MVLSIQGKFIGVLACCIVPAIILPYYCTIGGWVFKILYTFHYKEAVKMRLRMDISQALLQASKAPIIFGVVYLLLTASVVIGGVNKGIERFSKVLMPILVVLILQSVFY